VYSAIIHESSMEIQVGEELASSIQISKKQFKKMMFIYNALENGWTVKKSNDSYIFTKKHENRREIFQENYLETFLATHFTNVLDKS
jgi:hypothetical protein